MKSFIVMAAAVLITSVSFAQVTQDNIKQLLVIQGVDNPNAQAEYLYNRYTETKQHSLLELGQAISESALSGISMGLHQSRTAGYTNTGWMPKFMQDWYSSTVKTDNVYGKSLTWQKIFREADYMSDRLAYEDLDRYFNGKWYLAALTHLLVKNISGMMVRNEMRSGKLL